MSDNDQNSSNSISNENAKRILALIKEGEEKINFGSHRDVVLVLGNTGSGKSTFTHFIAGNNDDLISSEVGEDSGEFIISDINDKISFNTTVISKTTFPELLIDEAKTAYVDCPGFNDSRNEAYDIATSYFIKKVLDKAQNVKIVLIISYPSLRRGVNRNDVLQLLEHITILIKHIDKYVDSIALVATKVDNTFVMRQGVPVLRPDRTIIEQIAQFLQEVKASLKTMQNNETHTPEFKHVERKVFYENATKLLDALLSKNGTEYTKIGIFRRPNEAGKLSHVELLQNGKKNLKKILRQNIKYLPIDKPDIGYAVSDKSKTVIRDLVNEINDNITTDVTSIARDIIRFYHELEIQMYHDDMYALRDQLKNALSALKQITSIDRSANIDELVNTMCENFTLMNIKVPKFYIRDIKNLGKFLLFLQEIGAKKFESFVWKWAKELESAVNSVDNSFKWYNLLGVLHKRLSEYDIQKNTTIFHVPKLRAKNEVFRIDTSNDFNTFINEINDTIDLLKNIIYEDIKEIYLDSIKIQYFDRLIDVTLRDSITFTCTDDSKRLQVIGEYVKLSQISEHECSHNSTSIQILAKHSVFIDADLNVQDDISIMAPRWHIVGLRKISLDGLQGEPHSQPKAIDVFCEGCNGIDGWPGNPGTSGGHFFGVGSVFENSEKLVISANGGDGGIGQHGGDGMHGQNGENATEMAAIEDGDYDYRKIQLTCHLNQTCWTKMAYRYDCFSQESYSDEDTRYNPVQYTIQGAGGGRGGNSGRGGAGGVGGEGGNVTLIGPNYISTSTLSGSRGPFGLHGSCGYPGIGGYDISITYHYNYNYDRIWKYSTDRAPPGDFGTCLSISDDENSNIQGLRKSLKKEHSYSPLLTMSDFMTQQVFNMNNSITKKLSHKFFVELKNNEKLKNFFNAKFVLRSLQNYENRYNPFNRDTDAIFYNFLLSSTLDIAKSTEWINRNAEHQLLDFLRAALSFKLIELKNRSDDFSLLDHRKYFNTLAQANIDEIRNLYSNAIQTRIADTITFIESVLVTQIKEVNKITDHELAKLSQNDVNDDIDNLMLKKKLFASFVPLTNFLHLTLSLANVDLSVTNNTEIIRLFPSLTFQTVKIPNDIQAFRNVQRDIEILELKIIRQIDPILMVISNEIDNLQDLGSEFNESCNQLNGIQRELQSSMLAQNRIFTVGNVTKNALLRFDEVNVGLIKLAQNNAAVDLVKIIRKYQNHMNLIQFDTKIYHDIRHESYIDRILNAIDRINDNVSQINTAMQHFFEFIFPILKTAQTALSGSEHEPSDTQKIRQLVQTGLAQVRPLVHRMTEQSEMDEDLQTLSENLDEAFATVINIFDSLRIHEDRARLDVFLRFATDHRTVGQNDTQKILTSLQNDRLSYEYERSVDTFKRFAFPLETVYPSNVTIPSMLKLDQNVDNDNLKSAIANNVKILVSNLNSLQQSDEYHSKDYFNNTSNAGAFYVWKNEVYGNAIKKFLSGKKIALKATLNENHDREMIKFDSIKLAFRSSNDTVQRLLNERLVNFSAYMTHSGNSYYKLCNQTHLLYTDSTSLSYNFSVTGVQFEPILSPFTTWILKLTPINANASFSTLEQFREQQIDLLLEGHANYIGAQNQSICEQFSTGPEATNYTSMMTNNTAKITPNDNSSDLNRKRRDVTSQWDNFMPSFKGNFSFLKSFNPFNYFIGAASQTDQSSSAKSLEWNTESSTTTSTIQFSSNLNHSLAFLVYLVRNITKVKPYNARTTSNLDQVRVAALEIIDIFETVLSALGNELDIPPSQLELDPVQLMSKLEKELINGDPAAISKILRNSVTLDSRFKNRFDAELVRMLSQINDDSNRRSVDHNEKYFHSDHVDDVVIDRSNLREVLSSVVENYNASLLN